jgi:hypothetical protein
VSEVCVVFCVFYSSVEADVLLYEAGVLVGVCARVCVCVCVSVCV